MPEDRKERFKIKRGNSVDHDDDQLGENKYEAFNESNEPIGDKNKKTGR